MTDYFRYDVHFVMNITDIDDKVRSGYCASMAFAYDGPVCCIAFRSVPGGMRRFQDHLVEV